MLPVAERELRVAARDRKTYRSRWITALVVLLSSSLALWVMESFGGRFLSGRDLFQGFSTAALFFYVFGGAARTADCLSEEKREGTLGLLFLSDRKSGAKSCDPGC